MKRKLTISFIVLLLIGVLYPFYCNASSYPKGISAEDTKYYLCFGGKLNGWYYGYKTDKPLKYINNQLVATEDNTTIYNISGSNPTILNISSFNWSSGGKVNKGYVLYSTDSGYAEFNYSNYDVGSYQGCFVNKCIPLNIPISDCYIGDEKLIPTPKDGERVINYIQGYDSLKFIWANQKNSDFYSFSVQAIKPSFFGLFESKTFLTSSKTYSEQYIFNIDSPSMDFTYRVFLGSENGEIISDALEDDYTGSLPATGKQYFFKFSSAVKPVVDILGINNNATVLTAPTGVYIQKQNNSKQYIIKVNNNTVYNMTSALNDKYYFNKAVWDLGINTISIYDGINFVKSLTFTYTLTGTGESSIGGSSGGDDNSNPGTDYTPPSVDDSKPVLPSIDDDYSKWVLYYLKSLVYWVSMPFRLLSDVLKDLQKNVVDVLTSFKTTYNSLFGFTKSLFSYLPASVTGVITFGFGLGILLWFFGRK